MRVLILACLAALALATETVESLSNTEESITHINKKSEKSENDKEQQRQDEHQEKIQSPVQTQALVYPFAEPIPYTVLPQNILPLAQPAMVLPVFQPEVIQGSNSKATIFPKRHVMPFLKSPAVPIFQRQIPNLTDLKNPQLPLLQPLMHQVPQPLIQTPMLPTQPLLSLPQPKALPLSQQVITYPQRDMPIQALLLYQEPLIDPTQGSYPVTQPIATVYSLQQLWKNTDNSVVTDGQGGMVGGGRRCRGHKCFYQSIKSQYHSQNELGSLPLASNAPKPKANSIEVDPPEFTQ
ncbi:beta-casein-like [Phyllostomus hastatus]|uniref:beta-casein-like n=1 Tax=Phyllostomus hastatus TaxID=9423 RepID=UPI001E67E5C5|nr:beta-casein-like [Phyllostomus hastatus]